jgi:hypothetical protein
MPTGSRYSRGVSRRPFTVLAAAAIQGIQGVVLAGVGVTFLVTTLLGRAADTWAALGISGFAVVVGVVVCLVAWGLFRLRNWARTPVVLTQIFVFAYAWHEMSEPPVTLGLLLGIVGAGTLVLALAPATTAALYDEGSEEDSDRGSEGTSGGTTRPGHR